MLVIYVENQNMTSRTRPVIFLDFDGVIRYKGWSREALDNLNRLILFSEARVVVSSDWRHSHNLNDLKLLLKDLGVLGWEKVEHTPIMQEYAGEFVFYQPRSSEIEYYIRVNGIKNYVVLDDIKALQDSPLRDHLVLCEYEEGFTEDRLVAARKILNQNDDKS